MKLRIHKDSIRFRFTREEAKALSEGAVLAEQVAVGPLAEQQLSYRVVPDGPGRIGVAFAENTISVFVPQAELRTWYEAKISRSKQPRTGAADRSACCSKRICSA